ncbi:hypothetical protein [Erythrobacter oryzae]|uniref:hypothetical protein n=1 Tax=Erythrobacter oryzae TaxID=3019556 RepID=UPI0025545D4A|nr:hypothetical protein [Erythrobacter sp. COR-2]
MKALALAALIALSAPAHAEEPAPMPPDFTAVESLEAAQDLAKAGTLVPVLLFPVEVGGPDVPPNTVYITPEAAAERAKALATIIALLEQDKLDQMDVKPAFKGKSFVPSTIVMKAWHTRRDEKFEVTIHVW